MPDDTQSRLPQTTIRQPYWPRPSAEDLAALSEDYSVSLDDATQIMRYVYDGIEPRQLLATIICNDLKKALNYLESSATMLRIALFLYNTDWVPSICWGSDEQYKRWIDPDYGE